MKRVWLVCIASLLCGCAQTYHPVIDKKGVNHAQYERDLAECRAYAEEVDPALNAAGGAVVGAAAGMVIGGLAGAIVGDPIDATLGAGVGAVQGAGTGAIVGAGLGVQDQIEIINNCLAGRGYRVLRR